MVRNRDTREFPNALIGAIYDGLEKDKPWNGALEAMRVALGAAAASLRVSLKGAKSREYVVAIGPITSPERIAEFETKSARDLLPVDLQPGVARVINASEFTSKTTADLLKDHDVKSVVSMLIDVSDDVKYILQASRGTTAPDFDNPDLRLLELIGGHFGRALRLRRELLGARIVNGFQSDALDRLGIAAILVGWSGEFKLLNDTARAMLSEGEGLRAACGRLRAVDEQDDRRFQAMVKNVLASECERTQAMLIKQDGRARELNLVVSARQSVSLISDRPEAVALVFMRRMADADIEVLQQLFSFTRAESMLALGLANGKRLENVESELNIRHNTARAHLRSMFLKANVTRQSELVHRLTFSLASLGRPSEKAMLDS